MRVNHVHKRADVSGIRVDIAAQISPTHRNQVLKEGGCGRISIAVDEAAWSTIAETWVRIASGNEFGEQNEFKCIC